MQEKEEKRILPFLQIDLPGTAAKFTELNDCRYMGIHAAVNREDLTAGEVAFIGTEVNACVADIFGAAIAVYADVAKENIFNCLCNIGIIFGCNDKTRTDAVAANVIFTILECNGFCQHIDASFCNRVTDGRAADFGRNGSALL